jgi:signal transduction histidine kinase
VSSPNGSHGRARFLPLPAASVRVANRRSSEPGHVQQDPSPLEPAELEARRFDLASRLAGDLSHEIKNPLHAIVINLELVKRRIATADAEAALGRIAVVESEVHRVHRLIDAFLRLVRPPSPAGVVELDGVMDELLPVLEGEAKVARIEVRYAPAGEGTLIEADTRAIKHAVLQVFLHVLDRLEHQPDAIDLTGQRIDGGAELVVRGVPAPASGAAQPRADGRPAASLEIVRAFAGLAGADLSARAPGNGAVAGYTLRFARPSRT